MSKRLTQLKRDNPDVAAQPEVQDLARDIDDYATIDAYASSRAAGLLNAALIKDCASTIGTLTGAYRTADLPTLQGLCARLEARIAFLQTLNRARTNLELAEEALRDLTT